MRTVLFIHLSLREIFDLILIKKVKIIRMPESCSATAVLSTDKMQCTLKAHIATVPDFLPVIL